ncbi:Crp/Fnr family transcriptional regulator [Endozoicomonas numazuensis]|uniref:HTH crp-type domain-containing protein n=1 Tax=Endozoicomonas numazuensis TaxID=1137799 RepID=A0A081NK42_9GAMM|nr:Crp/Fnr family transcriptional regulator [Endozoicomonas numazuensis]KEQ18815.1 hypothetical protein GZ78_01665 [Endozoicomonas numazuensis]
MSDINLWYLRSLDFFKRFSKEDVESLTREAHQVKIDHRSPLAIRQQGVYLVLTGRIKLYRQVNDSVRMLDSVLEVGDLFGGIHGGEVSYELVPIQAATILLIEKEKFLDDMTNPRLYLEVMQKLEERQGILQARLDSLIFKDARTRIIETMVNLCREHAVACTHGFGLDLSITQEDIAQLVCVSRQVVNKVFRELVKEDVMHKNKGFYCIRSKESLLKLITIKQAMHE